MVQKLASSKFFPGSPTLGLLQDYTLRSSRKVKFQGHTGQVKFRIEPIPRRLVVGVDNSANWRQPLYGSTAPGGTVDVSGDDILVPTCGTFGPRTLLLLAVTSFRVHPPTV